MKCTEMNSLHTINREFSMTRMLRKYFQVVLFLPFISNWDCNIALFVHFFRCVCLLLLCKTENERLYAAAVMRVLLPRGVLFFFCTVQ